MQQPTIMEASKPLVLFPYCVARVSFLYQSLNGSWCMEPHNTHSNTLHGMIEQAHFLIRLTASFYSCDKHML